MVSNQCAQHLSWNNWKLLQCTKKENTRNIELLLRWYVQTLYHWERKTKNCNIEEDIHSSTSNNEIWNIQNELSTDQLGWCIPVRGNRVGRKEEDLDVQFISNLRNSQKPRHLRRMTKSYTTKSSPTPYSHKH